MEQNNNALLFIPDISGFTKFINETEISHSQHIIQELLELLVDANILGLTVSEYEGDAILFYRKGELPSLNKFLEQAEKMFVNFHTHLKRYDTHRLCQCGACKTAHNLTLKIIAHYGEAASMKIKDSEKLHGKDVILAHRLMKNSIDHHEYLLLTENLVNSAKNGEPKSEWYSEKQGSDKYDEIGDVKYSYSYLTPLLNKIPEEKPEEFRIEKPLKVFETERTINLSAEDVYGIVIDIPKRVHWIEGIKEVKLFDKALNQAGTRHLCVMEKGRDSDFITANLKLSDKAIEFWEIDRKKMTGCRFIFEKISDSQCRTKAEVYINDSLMLKMMFKMIMAKKVEKTIGTSIKNLKKYCESLKN